MARDDLYSINRWAPFCRCVKTEIFRGPTDLYCTNHLWPTYLLTKQAPGSTRAASFLQTALSVQ